jgi:hypothetical protein
MLRFLEQAHSIASICLIKPSYSSGSRDRMCYLEVADGVDESLVSIGGSMNSEHRRYTYLHQYKHVTLSSIILYLGYLI